MSSMQPDSNPRYHPRFEWKPPKDKDNKPKDNKPKENTGLPPQDQSKQAAQSEDPSLPEAKLHSPEQSYDTLKKFSIREIRTRQLSTEGVVTFLKSVGYEIPEEMLSELIRSLRDGGPINDEIYQACAPLMSEYLITQYVGLDIDTSGWSREVMYSLSRQDAPDGEEEDATIQASNIRVILRRGEANEQTNQYLPEASIDWEGLCFDVRELERGGNWDSADRILAELLPKLSDKGEEISFSLKKHRDLSDFVDDDLSEREGAKVLRFDPYEAILETPIEIKNSSAKADVMDDEGVSAEEYCDLAENPFVNVKKAPPQKGEPIIMQAPAPERLAKVARLVGLPLPKEVFSLLLELVAENKMLDSDVLFPRIKELGRALDFEQEVRYEGGYNEALKQTKLKMIDINSCFGQLTFTFERVFWGETAESALLVSLDIMGAADQVKKLNWKGLIEAAGY